MPYEPDDIDPRATYGLQVRVTLRDRLLFVNDTAFDVLTRGNPSRGVVMWVIAVGPRWGGGVGGLRFRDEVEELMELIDAQPLPEWQEVVAPGWPSQPGFSLCLPPGWTLNELQGIDSYVGEIVGDGVRLTFDYGGFSWSLDPADDPEHEYVVAHDDIGGIRAKFLVSEDASKGFTGVYFQDIGGPSLNLVGEDLTREQQRTAIAIFRSIRLLDPSWAGQGKVPGPPPMPTIILLPSTPTPDTGE